jgi:hypothetical protein
MESKKYHCAIANDAQKGFNIVITEQGEIVFTKNCKTPEEFQEYMERVIEDFTPMKILNYLK